MIEPEQKGLVHALECARAALNGEDFFLMLGDEVMQHPRRREMIDFFRAVREPVRVCGILKVNDLDQIRRTYALVKNDKNRSSA